jgi:non-canonical poly(A) RNA polymerase PAPD5/7
MARSRGRWKSRKGLFHFSTGRPTTTCTIVSADIWNRLALEINSFYTYSRPDPHEQTVRDHVIYKIKTFVEKRSPEYEIEVFGSEKTGLAFATSDIDLRLKPRHIEQPPSETIDTPTQNSPANPKQPNRKQNAPLHALRRLYHHGLRTHRSYLLPTFRYARYPLINLLDKQSNLSIQIVLAHDTSQSEELMARYAGDYPYLNELYFVLKAALEIRGLTDVFRGGLGSYPLLMMLVASIKLNPHPRNDAAGALINFLEFYGSFDNTAKGISIDPPELFDKAEVTVMSAKTKSKIEVSTHSFL